MKDIKCLSTVLDYHVPPEQLQCALALILQVSGTLLERWNTILPKDIIWCFYPFHAGDTTLTARSWHLEQNHDLHDQLHVGKLFRPPHSTLQKSLLQHVRLKVLEVSMHNYLEVKPLLFGFLNGLKVCACPRDFLKMSDKDLEVSQAKGSQVGDVLCPAAKVKQGGSSFEHPIIEVAEPCCDIVTEGTLWKLSSSTCFLLSCMSE